MNLPRFVVQLGLFLIFAVGISTTPTLLAQVSGSATLRGQVTSADGAGLPGATVNVTSPVLMGERTAVTNDEGDYILRGLPPGEYRVSVSFTGLKPVEVNQVPLSTDGTRELRVTLSTSTVVDEVIIVTSTPDSVLSGKQIQDLPLSSRSFANLALLSTSSAQSGRGARQLGISGGLTYDNLFLVNGISVADNSSGVPNSLFVEDAVAEFKVLTSRYQAEYGRATGALLTAVTRSGGNRFSGSGRSLFSRSDWQSDRTGFETPEGESQVYEATLGGPVLRDRLWFFAAGRKDNFESTQTLFPRGPNATGLFAPRESDDLRYEVKLTGLITSGHSIVANYFNVDRDETGVPPLSTAAMPNTLLPPSLTNDAYSLRYTGILTDNVFAEVGYSRKNFTLNGAGGTSRDVFNSPFFTFDGRVMDGPARNGLVPNERDNENILVKASYFLSTESLGSHDLAFGYDTFEDIRIDDAALSSTGVGILTRYVNDAQGIPIIGANGRVTPLWIPFSTTALIFPNLEADRATFKTNSFFINDTWRLNPNFSFNLGVRYDQFQADANGSPVVDSEEVSPRLGLTWDPKGDGNYIFNASYGEYVGALNSRLFSDGVFGDQVGYAVYTGPSGTGFGFTPGYNPNNYIPFFFVDTAASTVTDPDTTPPINREFSVGSEYSDENILVSARYTRRNMSNLVEDFVPFGPPTIPSFGGVSGPPVDTVQIRNSETGERTYEAIDVRFKARFSNRFSVFASYTQSKLEGNYAGVFSSGTPAFSANGNYSLAFPSSRYNPTAPIDGEDQLRRMFAWFTANAPLGSASLDLAAVGRYESGRKTLIQASSPLSAVQNSIATNAGYLSIPGSQTLYFNGDTATYDNIFSLDASATVTFNIGSGAGVFLKAEAFNVLNASGLHGFDTTIIPGGPNDAFGQPTTYVKGATFGTARSYFDYQPPREFRIGAGIRF